MALTVQTQISGDVFILDCNGRIASGHTDGSIRLWDIATATEVALLWAHEEYPPAVNSLALLSDGRLASACSDNTIRLWNLGTRTEAGRLVSPPYGINGVTTSVESLSPLPNGGLASGHSDGTVRVWNVASGTEATWLEGHNDGVAALAVRPGGWLASGSKDHTIRLWDLQSAKELARLEVDADVTCIVAFKDGSLAAGDRLGRLHWLDVLAHEADKARWLMHFANYDSGIAATAPNPSASLTCTACAPPRRQFLHWLRENLFRR
jgi:WD40 repeat protein